MKRVRDRSGHPHDIAFDGSRRSLLKGLGLAAAVCPFSHAMGQDKPAESGAHHVTDAPVANTTAAEDKVPFHGRHQAGIVTPRPAHGMIASFIVVADSVDDLENLFWRLNERIVFLTSGGTAPDVDPRLPPADSGIIGPVIRPNALTVTMSLGSSLFDDRSWLQPHKPRRLARMMRFPNDALNAELCHGDLTLQICAHTQDTAIHALRDIIKNIPDQLILKWKQEGNVPVIAPPAGGKAQSARNFLGFRDGSANPDSGDDALMTQIVWAGSDHDEPRWSAGGSYQVVRIIRNFVERWDRTPLQEQQHIIGRNKMSGAPLDRPTSDEFTTPDFAADQDGAQTPLDAHIRLANPRTAAAQDSLILRRPFNYSNGVTRSGQLDQGLLFICYQANLENGFIAVQKRLDGEPLEEYIKPVGGGYFYTLPGVESPAGYLGSGLIAAARATSAG